MAAPILNQDAFRHPKPCLELIEGDFDGTNPSDDRFEYNSPLEVIDYDSQTTQINNEELAITSLRMVLSNNSVYKCSITEQTDGDIVYDRLVGKSPAYLTDEKDPFNVDWSHKLAAKGMKVVDVSHEHILHKNPGDTVRRFLGSSLLNDTHAQLAALKLVADEELAGKVSREVVGTGLSKSCMTNLLMVGRAEEYGLDVAYIDGIDPSGEHGWGLRDIRDISRIGMGTIIEVKEIAEITTKYSLDKIPDVIRRHILLSPQSAAGHIAATKGLILSEAGREFIIPTADIIMHITCFKDCWFNQHNGWMKRLGNLTNVHVNVEQGGHLRGGSEAVREASVERIARVQNLLKKGYASKDINPATQMPYKQIAV
jgi:hypothetical protein